MVANHRCQPSFVYAYLASVPNPLVACNNPLTLLCRLRDPLPKLGLEQNRGTRIRTMVGNHRTRIRTMVGNHGRQPSFVYAASPLHSVTVPFTSFPPFPAFLVELATTEKLRKLLIKWRRGRERKSSTSFPKSPTGVILVLHK